MTDHKLVSFGGCGTWFLARSIRRAGIVLESKHYRDPSVYEDGKVVYLYGNPINAVLSFSRKNKNSFMNTWFRQHAANLEVPLTEPGINFEWIIQHKIDPFKLKDHFDAWFNYEARKYNIMFLKYETIPDHVQEIRDWFESDKINLDFKQRSSKEETISPRTLDILKEIYGDLYDTWNELEDIIIKWKY